MAATSFTVEGIGPDGNTVSVEVKSGFKENALIRGKAELVSNYGKVRRVTVRYTASDFRMSASDFVDPNRSAGDGSED